MATAQSIYPIALAISVFTSGILRGRITSHKHFDFFITLFLSLISFQFLMEWLMIHPSTPLKALWLGLLMGSSMLLGPTLFLGSKSISINSKTTPKLTRSHILPIIAAVVTLIPLISSAHTGNTFPNVTNPTSPGHALFIHVTMLICMVMFLVQTPIYLELILNKIVAQQIEGSLDCDEKIQNARLLKWLMLVLTSIWLLALLRLFQCTTGIPGTAIFVRWVALIQTIVTSLCLFAITRNRLALMSQPIEAKVAPPLSRAIRNPASGSMLTSQKYAKSSIPPEIRERIKVKLDHCMREEELYRDSLLNLKSLSKSIAENTHFTSQVINQDLHTHFYAFVNTFRIEQAKKDILRYPDRSILEIALEVGFNSKSTFNTAFRKQLGTTPSLYRKAHS